MAGYDLMIRFEGELAPEVTGVDALLFAYSRIGKTELKDGVIAFGGDCLNPNYRSAADFIAGLMGAGAGVIANEGIGRVELSYNLTGLEALVLRESDKSVIAAKNQIDKLIDIAITGVIYENLSEPLRYAVDSGKGVNSSVRLIATESGEDETTAGENTYNIITSLGNPASTIEFAKYGQLYYASQVTTIVSAMYGYISSAKRMYQV